MGRCHLANASILACVTGFGKNIVPLFRLRVCGSLLGLCPQLVECSWKNRSLGCFHELGNECFHNFSLPLIAFELLPYVRL